jgi:hypothetical protein
MSRLESGLLLSFLLGLLLACFGPYVPQMARYHEFADQRALLGIPLAMDVLSNLSFAIAGGLGLVAIGRLRLTQFWAGQRPLAALFFSGLVLTALCSGVYHWRPDDAGLVLDRLGMVLAFAGLIGVAVADRISLRAGWWSTELLLLLGPVAVAVWYLTGNLLPWSVLQGGGLMLLLALALRRPVPGAWGVALGWVIASYVLAKVFELGDQAVFAWTVGWISGHSLKHLVAALAAWPVIACVHNAARAQKA